MTALVKTLLGFLTLSLLFSMGSLASTFDGATMRATTSYPTLPGHTSSGPFDRVVDNRVEFPSALFTPFFGPSFDFGDDTLSITHTATSHAPAVFNGWIFNDLTNALPDFTSFSIISDTSGFFLNAPSRLSFDAENLRLNFQGLSFGSASDEIVLKVGFAPTPTVPLPAGVPLIATGLGLFAYLRKRA